MKITKHIVFGILTLSSFNALASDATTGSLKMSTFFDFRFSGYTPDKVTATTFQTMTNQQAHAATGFGLEDGAFYWNYENGKVSAVIDLAFRRAKGTEIDPAATNPGESQNNSLSIGKTKSQAYVKYTAGKGAIINFGQMDTPYGVEKNDSINRVFGQAGLVYSQFLPITHTGFMLDLPLNETNVKIFAANPNKKGSHGTSANEDESTEYGIAIKWANDTYRAQLGHMTRPILAANTTTVTRGDRNMSEVILGMSKGAFGIDLEYVSVADDSRNDLTAVDTDKEKANGVLALITYNIGEKHTLGLRYESLTDAPYSGLAADLTMKKVTSTGVNFSCKSSSNLTWKTEYIAYSYEKDPLDGTEKSSESEWNVAAIVNF